MTDEFNKDVDIDEVIKAAKAKNYDAQEYLFETLTSDSSPEIRAFILRHGLFAALPPDEIYLTFDTGYNQEFHQTLLVFVRKTHLLSELKVAEPDDALIETAIAVFSYWSIAALEDVEWRKIDADAKLDEILLLLVDHLHQRKLSISAMFDLAYAYEILFSDTYRWLSEEPIKKINDADIIVSRQDDFMIARKILDVFDYTPNKLVLDNALSSMGNTDYYAAMQIMLRTTNDDPFDLVYRYMLQEIPRDHRIHVNYSVLKIMFDAIGISREKAEKTANWCSDYCQFQSRGGYFPAPAFEYILQSSLRVIKRFPGVGSSLIVYGLESPARRLAAEALLAWPIQQWPPELLWRLDSSVKDAEITVTLLRDARDKLKGSETSDKDEAD